MKPRFSTVRRRLLDQRTLDDIALRYVGRYATTRAKLGQYLRRKLSECGWKGEKEPDVDALVGRLAQLGYVDDRGFALSKVEHHNARGLGRRRLSQALYAAGIADADRIEAIDRSTAVALETALRFARRRRLGPFAAAKAASPADRQKAIAAFVRAGHELNLAIKLVSLDPQPDCDINLLLDDLRHTSR